MVEVPSRKILRYLARPDFIGPPQYPSMGTRKSLLKYAIARAVEVNNMTPEHKLLLGILHQAVNDIGITGIETQECWDNGQLDMYCHMLNIDPEYLKTLVIQAGLYHVRAYRSQKYRY